MWLLRRCSATLVLRGQRFSLGIVSAAALVDANVSAASLILTAQLGTFALRLPVSGTNVIEPNPSQSAEWFCARDQAGEASPIAGDFRPQQAAATHPRQRTTSATRTGGIS